MMDLHLTPFIIGGDCGFKMGGVYAVYNTRGLLVGATANAALLTAEGNVLTMQSPVPVFQDTGFTYMEHVLKPADFRIWMQRVMPANNYSIIYDRSVPTFAIARHPKIVIWRYGDTDGTLDEWSGGL